MNSELGLAWKHEVINTCATRGWPILQKLAEQLVTKMEREAIDEEDDIKGNALRREAKAARKFVKEFMEAIESCKRVEVVEPSDNSREDYDFD